MRIFNMTFFFPFRVPVKTLMTVGFCTAFMAGAHAIASAIVTLNPATDLSAWDRHDFSGETLYEARMSDMGIALRARSNDGDASLLWRRVDISLSAMSQASWAWRVDEIQESAEMTVKGRDDYAAAIFFMFEEPGMFNPNPKTLAYVWGSTDVMTGDIAASARNRNLRAFVLHDETTPLKMWQREERAIFEDYREAFGEAPPGPVVAFGYFTDSDQTGEAAIAWYGPLTVMTQMDNGAASPAQ